MGGWNISFCWGGWPISRGYVSFRECILTLKMFPCHPWPPPPPQKKKVPTGVFLRCFSVSALQKEEILCSFIFKQEKTGDHFQVATCPFLVTKERPSCLGPSAYQVVVTYTSGTQPLRVAEGGKEEGFQKGTNKSKYFLMQKGSIQYL